MNYKRIFRTIDKYKYVSFDLYDTLVKRNCSRPTKVFDYIEHNYKIKDFSEKRRQAELKARQITKKEVTLKEIYDNIKLDDNKLSIKEIMDIEIRIEERICELNKELIPILDYCIEKNKIIIITTDMYLPKKNIEKILVDNKITYNRLFVSSEIKETKANRKLFKYILRELHTDKGEIIHIGDNFKSDYINPMMCGISAIKIKSKNKKIDHYVLDEKIENNIFKAFIENNIGENDDYFEIIGFSIFGPILYKFCEWLNNEVKQNNISAIFFLSRDGLIIKKAYERIYGSSYNNKYFFASRRALIVPSLQYYSGVEEMINNMYINKKEKVAAILKNLGLDLNENIIERADKYGINVNDSINIFDSVIQKDCYYKFIKELEEEIYEESRKENVAFQKYLETQLNNSANPERVAIVDIGWFGNMQKAFKQIIDREKKKLLLYGFYIGLNPQNINQKELKMKGFLFDKNHNKENYEKERRFNSVFETMFTASHSSLKKYEIINRNVLLVFKKNDNSDKTDSIKSFQKGALNFIERFKRFNEKIKINISMEDCLAPLLDLGLNPKMKDAINWGNMEFDNGASNNYIAKPASIKTYLIKPSRYLIDLNESFWKHGFLKRTLKIKINYDKLYEWLKNKRN